MLEKIHTYSIVLLMTIGYIRDRLGTFFLHPRLARLAPSLSPDMHDKAVTAMG